MTYVKAMTPGMKKYQNLLIAAIFMLTLAGCGASVSDSGQISHPRNEAGQLTVSFDYETQSGYASNQFAVWIEDADGKLVKTLCATAFTAKGGYKNRPDSILNWVGKSELSAMPKEQVDAITGATPKSGKLSYVWDLTDSDGDAVPDGNYAFWIEGTLRWKNYAVFSGDIAVGGEQ
ncbi:MAG: DUF2271 domain-containing protein, partial [Peptococcaceae bacterium]|nr:DUF2271 domain-containing protein [Peptococcaceae bacterium]